MKYKIIVDKQSRTNPSNMKKEYVIDIEELRFKGDVYDSIVITPTEAYVIRRLSLNEYQVLSVLKKSIKEPLGDLNIQLFEGENYIYLFDMEGNKFYAEYLLKSDVTDMYVTTKEMTSTINQTAQSIELSVNYKFMDYSTTEEMYTAINMKENEITSTVSEKYSTKDDTTKAKQEAIDEANSSTNEKLKDYSTTTQMKSEIKQTADSIDLKVEGKLDEENFTGANIMLAVNNDSSTAQIKADKVNLDGYVTISNLQTEGQTIVNGSNITTGKIDASKVTVENLNADNITSGTITGRAILGGTITGTEISNGNNFNVDADGNMTCSNATIINGNVNVQDDGTYGNGQIIATNKNNKNRETILYSDGVWVKSDYNGNIGSSLNSNQIYISNSSTTEDVPLYGIVGTLGSDNINPYFEIFNNTSSTIIYPDRIVINQEGPAMYGMNEHKYRCKWTGSELQFWVDETNVGTLSDKRLKTEIQDIDEDFIKAIREIEMKQFKIANRNGLTSFGILAQDLIEIFEKYNKNPFEYEIVQETQYRTDDETIYYTINYEQYLILKTKSQEIEIQQLQEKDKQKDELLQNLIKRIEKLEAR